MSQKSESFLKRLWADPVWSKVIGGVILGTGALLVSLTPIGTTEVHFPPFSLETLKNFTYLIEGEKITLNDGKREFIPQMDGTGGFHEKSIAVYLTDHAFGDVDGDGNVDAVAVLQVSDGGTGIYYYLAPLFNEKGTPTQHEAAFVLGDRLEFRSVAASVRSVDVELMMHARDDALCCPTQFRKLKFSAVNRQLQCQTQPCSEVP